jgi:hypothetical protein
MGMEDNGGRREDHRPEEREVKEVKDRPFARYAGAGILMGEETPGKRTMTIDHRP